MNESHSSILSCEIKTQKQTPISPTNMCRCSEVTK